MLVEEDGWTAGRPARYISYAVAARRRGELLLAIYARHVASHHTSNGINLHRASSTAPATRRAVLEVSLSLSVPSLRREKGLHPSSTLSRIVESVKIRRIESKGSETSIIRSG